MFWMMLSTSNVEQNTSHITSHLQETVAVAALNMLRHIHWTFGRLKCYTWDIPRKSSRWLSSITLFRSSNRCYLCVNSPRKGSASKLLQLAGGVQEVPKRMTNLLQITCRGDFISELTASGGVVFSFKRCDEIHAAGVCVCCHWRNKIATTWLPASFLPPSLFMCHVSSASASSSSRRLKVHKKNESAP